MGNTPRVFIGYQSTYLPWARHATLKRSFIRNNSISEQVLGLKCTIKTVPNSSFELPYQLTNLQRYLPNKQLKTFNVETGIALGDQLQRLYFCLVVICIRAQIRLVVVVQSIPYTFCIRNIRSKFDNEILKESFTRVKGVGMLFFISVNKSTVQVMKCLPVTRYARNCAYLCTQSCAR